MKALQGLTSTLAGKHVPVIARGDRAYTDHNTVVIPYLGDNLTKEQLTLLAGYNDHESEHVIDSDPAAIHAARREGGERLNRVRNMVEDIRIENNRARRYAGAYHNLQTLAQFIFDTPRDNPFNQFLYEARRQVIGFTFPMPVVADQLKAYFGDDLFAKIAQAKNSWDALDIARDMLQAHEDNKQQQQEQEQDEQEQETEQDETEQETGAQDETEQDETEQDETEQEESEEPGDCQDGEQEAELDESDTQEETDTQDETEQEESEEPGECQEGDIDDEPVEEQEESEEPVEGQEGTEQEGDIDDIPDETDDTDIDGDDDLGGGGGEEIEDGDGDDGDDDRAVASQTSGDSEEDDSYDPEEVEAELEDFEDPMERMRKELSQWHEDVCSTGAYMPFTTEDDKTIEVQPGPSMDSYNRYKNKLGGLNTKRAKAVQMFKAKTARRWYGGQEEGRLDSRMLASVRRGNRKVFKTLTKNVEIDTAVTFIKDMSISMAGERIETALKAEILLQEMLAGAGVKTESTGFTTTTDQQHKEDGKYDRCEGVINYVFKSFSEPFNNKTKRRIGEVLNQRTGYTCDFEGLKFAYHRIAQRPEKRKIVIMLSDGDTSFYGNELSVKQHMKQMIKEMESKGIEILAYGLYDDSVKQYYKNHVLVEAGDDLSEKVFEGLKKILNV